MTKYFTIALIILVLSISGIFVYQNHRDQPPIKSLSQPAFLKNFISPSLPAPVLIEEPLCDNEKDVEHFEKPVLIIWTATFDGCLASCSGGSFTRATSDARYPRFAAYYPDVSGKYDWDIDANGHRGGSQIPSAFRDRGRLFTIYGRWVGVGDEYSRTVFDHQCVPVVEIAKIEITKE